MSEAKNEIVKITITLLIFYLIGGAIIVSGYAFTKPIIDKNNAAKKVVVLRGMVPGVDKVDNLGKWTVCDKDADYFKVSDKNGNLLGYVVESYGLGYSSFIHSMIAVDSLQKITAVSILGHAETPGLGDGVENATWRDQFKGKSLENMEVVKKSGTDKIQAISGATISSRAVVNGQRAALTFLSKALQK
jgi:Na+-translocating ferredoxin:NAD+ oxidoreductase subunit G